MEGKWKGSPVPRLYFGIFVSLAVIWNMGCSMGVPSYETQVLSLLSLAVLFSGLLSGRSAGIIFCWFVLVGFIGYRLFLALFSYPSVLPDWTSLFWVFILPVLSLLGIRTHEESTRTLSRLKALGEKMDEIASVDEVTGLEPGKRFAMRVLEEMSRSRRNKSVFSLLLVNLEHRECIEKVYGALVLDEVLRGLSEELGRIKREEDHLATIKPGEFVLLLPDTEREDGLNLADRMLGKIRHVKISSGVEDVERIKFVISVGISTFPFDGEDFASLLQESRRGSSSLRSGMGEPVKKPEAPGVGGT